jgi:hypothetical protein
MKAKSLQILFAALCLAAFALLLADVASAVYALRVPFAYETNRLGLENIVAINFLFVSSFTLVGAYMFHLAPNSVKVAVFAVALAFVIFIVYLPCFGAALHNLEIAGKATS